MSQYNKELFAVLELVHDEETFLRFLTALQHDNEASEAQERLMPSSPYGPAARGWENTTIDRFFEAAVRWARASSKGLPLVNYLPPSNPWRRCAEILYAAKGYE